MPEDKDTKPKMKGLALSEEQKKVMAELQKYQQMLQRENQAANDLQNQLARQVNKIAEVTGVVKYLRAQLPTPEEIQQEGKDVTLDEEINLREPKTK